MKFSKLSTSISYFCAILFFANTLQAQNEEDVMRYSFLNNASTARAKSIGGATGSIGADFSGISVNPATLGRYSKSEFSITYGPKFFNTKSTFYNTTNATENSKGTLDNIGFVISSKANNPRWKSTSFAIGLNTLENYNRNYTYSSNSNSSITDYWAALSNANGGYANIASQNENIALAFNVGLLDTATGGNNLYSVMPDGLNITQTKNKIQSGNAREVVIAVAGNKNDKWYVGGMLGIPLINYTTVTEISEIDNTVNASNYFNRLYQKETLLSSGGGINAKFGVIYSPTKLIRIGASLTSPSVFSITDFYNLTMAANTENAFGNLENSMEPIKFNYDVNTPAKALLSGSYLFGSKGFITADYEYVNYKGAHLSFSDGFETFSDAINARIKTNYKASSNVRMGAEWRIKNISLRAGYARIGSPLKNSVINNAQTRISGGLGYRWKKFFADAALVKAMQQSTDLMYNIAGLKNTAILKTNDLQTALTIGWKF